jgi:Ca2+-binding RTX toxin-like protein
MHIRIPAGPRRRTRRALIAAALPLVAAAVALPAAAQAATVATIKSDNRLGYFQTRPELNENNNVRLRVVGNQIVISDVVTVTAGNGCQAFNQREAVCPANVAAVDVSTFGGSDTVEYQLPHEGSVDLGLGSDRLIAGKRQPIGRAIQPVRYFSGSGHDEITYAGADRGVSHTPEDNLANDGRPGIDRENVTPGFDVIVGSPFSDSPLFGTDLPEVFHGLGGNDFIAGGHGDDLFATYFAKDGADDYHGGPGRDTIHYFGRTQGVVVRLDNVADDGERGEGDFVRTNVENLIGGNAGDVLDSGGAHSLLDGAGGGDALFGGSGPDTLIGGPGTDNLNAGGGNDVVDSRDATPESPAGQIDAVDCSEGIDSLMRNSQEWRVRECENVSVGKLRLTPKSTQAAVGETARLQLSWRHPKAWKQLRTIELRLTRDGVPVGAITIRARGKKITGDGAVASVARSTRIAAKGKTVTARLAVRLDGSVAGATLKAEVEATDRRGRRQLERNAATIRVAK